MTVYLIALVVLFFFMTALFLLALRLEDNSIVDIAYGPAFVVSSWTAFWVAGTVHPRALLLLGLVTLWGVRLAIYTYCRKQREQGEDSRYRQWRESWGKSFVWRSFLQVFMLQGAVVFVVALPVLLTLDQPSDRLGLLDGLGLFLWLVGFGFETLADWQLLQFKQDPANHGRILQSGLRRYSRHPNYFGEATLWWGMFLIAVNSPYGWVALLSPLLIGFLLLKVSGIPMLEAKYEGRPEFEAYRQRTNAFFPWPPKQRKETG